MNNDPWQHRSDNMKCKTCMWFVPKIPEKATLGAPLYDMGRCRRHAPSMNGYPVVMVNDWCGDHKLDENKFFETNQDKVRVGQWQEVPKEMVR